MMLEEILGAVVKGKQIRRRSWKPGEFLAAKDNEAVPFSRFAAAVDMVAQDWELVYEFEAYGQDIGNLIEIVQRLTSNGHELHNQNGEDLTDITVSPVGNRKGAHLAQYELPAQAGGGTGWRLK